MEKFLEIKNEDEINSGAKFIYPSNADIAKKRIENVISSVELNNESCDDWNKSHEYLHLR